MCEAYRQQIKQTTKQNISKKPDEEGFSSFKLVTVWWKRREIQETITSVKDECEIHTCSLEEVPHAAWGWGQGEGQQGEESQGTKYLS